MKKLIITVIFYLVLLFGFFSCDETSEALNGMNKPPRINSSTSEQLESFSDSIKVNSRFNNYYPIEVSVYDPNDNIKAFNYELLNGAGELYNGGERILNNNVIFNDDLLRVRYKPTVLGKHVLVLTVIDDFDKTSSIQIDLTAFSNLNPVSVLYFNKLGINSKYEYELIGKESYDRDERFGGKVRMYEFTLQNKRIVTQQPVIIHIFPGEVKDESNIYEVSLRVQDSDGIWSEEDVVYIDITK